MPEQQPFTGDTTTSQTRTLAIFYLACGLAVAAFMLVVFHDLDPRYDTPAALCLGISWLAASVGVIASLRLAARGDNVRGVHRAAVLIVGHVGFYNWLDADFGGAPTAAIALAWLAVIGVIVVEAANVISRRKKPTEIHDL